MTKVNHNAINHKQSGSTHASHTPKNRQTTGTRDKLIAQNLIASRLMSQKAIVAPSANEISPSNKTDNTLAGVVSKSIGKLQESATTSAEAIEISKAFGDDLSRISALITISSTPK